jgi:hypothetical protein
LEVLDKLLSCLRLQLPKSPERPAAELQQRALQLQAQLQALPHPDAPGDLPVPGTGLAAQGADASSGQNQWLSTAALLRDLASQRRALSAEDRPYEVPFDKRAIDAVADAIGMGILPSLKVSRGRVLVVYLFRRCIPVQCSRAWLCVMLDVQRVLQKPREFGTY